MEETQQTTCGTGSVSNDRLYPAPHVAELVEGAIVRAKRVERLRIAEVIQLYPIDSMFYDDQNITTEEILRFRDTLSQAILKDVPKGERIK